MSEYCKHGQSSAENNEAVIVFVNHLADFDLLGLVCRAHKSLSSIILPRSLLNQAVLQKSKVVD